MQNLMTFSEKAITQRLTHRGMFGCMVWLQMTTEQQTSSAPLQYLPSSPL